MTRQMSGTQAPDLSRDALAAANICPSTKLATDYLNHFNEPAMLVDMLDAMPEAAEDILEWEPRTYVEHFETSGFRDKELAIAAYSSADPHVIARFEAACADVNADLGELQDMLRKDDIRGAAARSQMLYAQISRVNDIIVGGSETLALDDIENEDAQSAIDALFDD